MKEFVIETERLIMKPFSTRDSVHMFQLNSDARILEHTGDVRFETVSDAEDFLRSYDQFEKYKMGRFSVFNKANHRFLGWSGLRYNKQTELVDLGFRFAFSYWNKGYATESANAFLAYGINQLGLKKIIARSRKSNLGSIKVFEKLNMVFTKEFEFDGHTGVLYEMDSKRFRNS